MRINKLDKSVQITLIIVVGIVILAILGYVIFSSIISPSNKISVNGYSEIEAFPDLVGIYFNIETKGSTSEEATKENSKIVEELKDSLIMKGFDREDIKTQNFNVYPDYDWVSGKRINKGYKAVHSLKLELSTEDTSKIGLVINAGVEAGAGISYINFELTQEKQNEYKAEAIKQASEDARIKAEAMAQGLGQKLGNLVSVSDSGFDYYPWRVYGAIEEADVAVAKEATTDIQPDEQKITARVSAVFKLK
jgi:uncharacterized protein YggE